MAVSRPTEPGQSHQTQKINVLQRHIWQAVYGRLHFPSQSDHLYIREGTFPSQIHLTFSNPSQLLCNSSMFLNAFSNQNVGKYSTFSNGNTFSAPSQMEYMFYISRNLLRFFSMEIPSQLLLKWSTCSTSVLMISYEIRKSLESKNSHSAHQSTYLFALCMVWAIVWPNF